MAGCTGVGSAPGVARTELVVGRSSAAVGRAAIGPAVIKPVANIAIAAAAATAADRS
jgi:hypothetical protein